MKITRAMELIAASRIPKATARVSASKPYSAKLVEVIRNVSAASGGASHMLLERRAVKNAGVLIVAGAAIGESSQRCGRGQVPGPRGVEDDEVVAETMHLRELEPHGARIAETALQPAFASIPARLAAMPSSSVA